WFERVSMLVILLNCVPLGLYQPCQPKPGLPCGSPRCSILEICDHFVFAFFAIEMLIKMLAMGVWGKLGYLGEAWNRLDFFIVLCGMMEYTLQLEDTMNFTSVRTVRVLRPLRAINRVPNMRILVMLLLDTLPMLGNVLMLCSFVFFIFGVVAVQLWEGTLRQRCFLDPNINLGNPLTPIFHSSLEIAPFYSRGEEDLAICSLPMDSGEFHCSDRSIITPFTVENITCSKKHEPFSGTPMCIDWNQYMNTCKAGDSNPSLGSINFDNIMYAWVAIFQVISLEGWVDIMYYLMDGYSFYSFIYFILLIVIGSFFMINLCLVVIATQFSETKQREQRLMEEQRLRFKSNDSTLASYSPPGNCYEEMLKYISHLYRKNKRKIKRRWHKWQTEKKLKRSGMGSLKREVPVRSVRKKKKSIHLHHHHHHHHHHYHIADTIDRTEGLIRTLERRDRGLAITSDACPHTPQNFTQILPQRLMLTDGSNELVEPVKTGRQPLVLIYLVALTFVLCSFIFNGTNDGSRFVLLTVPIHTPSASTSLHSICGAVGIPQRTNSYRDRRPSAEVTVNDPGSVYFKPRGLDPCFQPEILSTKFCPEDITVYHYNAIIIQVFFIFHSLNSIATSPTDILGKNNTLPRPQSFVTSELNCSCAEYEISNPEVFEPGVESDLDEKPPTSYRRFLCCCCDQRETKEEKEKERFSFLRDFQEQTKRVVDSSYFNRGIMIAILINTLSMGIEHHSQPDGLTEVLEISNVIFTTLFALEMIAKIVAFGVAGYTKNLYNVFDALIVIISIWEIAAGTQNSGGGLSVLRTFRLLRVLKLVRFMPALQRQLVVLMKTMDNVATFMMLLTLFIFIFSILGMHLFGCDFCWVNQYGRTECDRKNFDSLLWAFVTVFQILTQEDWNIVLYNGMAATSPFASIYFITLMTIGNYVLFSLLVAILVEGFQAETSSDEDEEVELLTRGQINCVCLLKYLCEFHADNYKLSDNNKNVNYHKNKCFLSLIQKFSIFCSFSPPTRMLMLCPCQCCSTSVEIQRADDDSDSEFDEPPILAENYTKKVAKALGITGPKNVNGNTGHARKKAQHHMHVRIIALVEFSSMVLYHEEVELLTRGRCPLIKVSTSKGGFYFYDFLTVCSPSQEKESENWSLPVITRTSATPLHTPTLANISQENSLEKSFLSAESRGSSTDSQTEKDANHNTPQSVKKHAILSRKPSTEVRLFAVMLGFALNLQTNCRTNKGILITTKSRKNHHFITKYFLQSCLSISSVIKFGGGSPLSRTGSWRLRKLRKIPTDQQSLVCSDEDSEIEEDMYSNASFENEYKEREEITKNSSTDCSNKAIPSHNQNNNNSVLTNENTTNTNEKTEITSSKSESTGNSTEIIPKLLVLQCKGCCLSQCRCPILPPSPPNWTYTRKEWSLYLFSPELKFRRAVQKITEHKVFDNTILLLIFGNCITIAMERPSLKEGDYEREVLDCFNNIFTFVFLLELILKVIASGFYVGPKAYLKSGWNVLDFFLVSTSLIDFIMTLAYSSGSKLLGMLRVFRLLRALRPLRVISRAPGLKLVVQTLISSLKPIGNIVLICCAFFIIFGILGVQVLKGKFYRCVGPDLRNVTNKSNCLANPNNNWVNRRFSYQLPLNGSLKQVFLTIPPEWLTYTGFLSKYPQLAHLHRAIFFNEYELLEYLSSFSLILSRIRSNLATSTVHWEYRRRKQERLDYKKSMRHARGEQRLNFRRKTLSRAKNQEYGPARRALHDVCMNKYFEIGISIVIGINILTMAAEHYKQPKVLDQALKIANYFFTAVFILEAVLKLIALGFRRYFRDRWNQVDMLIVILSVVGIAVEALMTSGDERSLLINPTIIRVMRVLRIARVLKLLKVSKGIRSLLETVGNALPQVGNLGLLFLLLFFIFAALGVELFGTLSCDEAHPCNGLSRHASFSNFGIALLTLFRISTGDNWNGIMKDTIRQECDASDSCMVNCCSSSIISPIYFVLFVMTAQFVLVNVVVAVLMK
uniref:Ion transport domain-containing protein n=1 Tax=Ciona savignyi TaxID=51511 RepID=H2YFL9_CIOSA